MRRATMSESPGLDKILLAPALKATAYGVDTALRTAARVIGAEPVYDAVAAQVPVDNSDNPVHSLRIWFKGFIPEAKIAGPPFTECFLGDNRTESADRAASARMHSEIFLEGLNTAHPTMTETHRCGESVRVDCDSGEVLDSATASTDGMRFYNYRYPGAEVFDWNYSYPPAANPGTIIVPKTAPLSVDYVGLASNPLLPSPASDVEAHIELDLPTGLLTVSGAVDDFPAFEGYALVNERHGPIALFSFAVGGPPSQLVGGPTRPFAKTINVAAYAVRG